MMDHISIKSINDQSAHILPSNLKENKCPLCADATVWHPSRLKRHYESLHGKHYVTFGDQVALLCKLNCDDKIKNDSHYHCPEAQCSFLSRQRYRMLVHFQKHSHYRTWSRRCKYFFSEPTTRCTLEMCYGRRAETYIYCIKATHGPKYPSPCCQKSAKKAICLAVL